MNFLGNNRAKSEDDQEKREGPTTINLRGRLAVWEGGREVEFLKKKGLFPKKDFSWLGIKKGGGGRGRHLDLTSPASESIGQHKGGGGKKKRERRSFYHKAMLLRKLCEGGATKPAHGETKKSHEPILTEERKRRRGERKKRKNPKDPEVIFNAAALL